MKQIAFLASSVVLVLCLLTASPAYAQVDSVSEPYSLVILGTGILILGFSLKKVISFTYRRRTGS
jgi:hypothetical protein